MDFPTDAQLIALEARGFACLSSFYLEDSEDPESQRRLHFMPSFGQRDVIRLLQKHVSRGYSAILKVSDVGEMPFVSLVRSGKKLKLLGNTTFTGSHLNMMLGKTSRRANAWMEQALIFSMYLPDNVLDLPLTSFTAGTKAVDDALWKAAWDDATPPSKGKKPAKRKAVELDSDSDSGRSAKRQNVGMYYVLLLLIE